MAKSDFMPRKDDDLVIWLDCFLGSLPALAAKYNISPAELTAVTAGVTAFKTKFTTANTKIAEARAAVTEKDLARVAVEKLVRAIGRRVKAGAAYDRGDGLALGIVGHDRTVDLRTHKPHLKGRDLGRGRVEFRFKKSNSDGIYLYCKRGEETAWTQISTHTRTKFFDDRPLLVSGKPELRIYRAIYFLKDQPIGEYSNQIEITCAP